ncbi:MAG TPA: hypothetical protein V6C88_06035 [Chroococcidiopsis sp.]
MTPGPDQLLLFSPDELRSPRPLTDELEISPEALQDWKQRVAHYQRHVIVNAAPQQGSLFDLAPAFSTDPTQIDPFGLPQQNTEFWRWKASEAGVAALYFVIDYTLPLLLYVGETCKSGQRWKGEHDCKRYLLSYRQAHYQHRLPTQLGIAFWGQAPDQTRPRQKLESALIYRWRSPFNKENWEFWGTPFVGK